MISKLLSALKKHSPKLPISFRPTFNEVGATWQRSATSNEGDAAFELLTLLAAEGLATQSGPTVTMEWSQIYSVLANPSYEGLRDTLGLPATAALRPTLRSEGSPVDGAEFKIIITGWRDEQGATAPIKSTCGAVLTDELGEPTLMPRAAYDCAEAVSHFWQLLSAEKDEATNRAQWGRIRTHALEASAQLDQFLAGYVVVSPEKLQLELRKATVGDVTVAEVIPRFEGCPDGWLDQFDRSQSVKTRYAINQENGLTEVILQGAVKTALEEVKRMPNRRAVGAKAFAFVQNPFAALGGDLAGVLDETAFEQERVRAGLFYQTFCAAITCDAFDNPIEVGIQIRFDPADTTSNGRPTYQKFEADNDIEQFVARARHAISEDNRIFSWRGLEFEITSDTLDHAVRLDNAAAARKRGFIEVRFEDVCNLDLYSPRVTAIDIAKPYLSVFIVREPNDWGVESKKSVILVRTPDGTPIQLEVTPEFPAKLETAIAEAKSSGKQEVLIAGVSTPIPLAEAERAAQHLSDLKSGKIDPNASPPDFKNPVSKASNQRHIAVIGNGNIDATTYAEARQSFVRMKSVQMLHINALHNSTVLKAHQKHGIAWLQHLFARSPQYCRGALLADDMGLGKTLQLLAFIAWAFERDEALPPALVVAPVSLLENWQLEIEKFLNPQALPICVAYGDGLRAAKVPRANIDQRLIDERGITNFLRIGWRGNARLVLTTYETLRDYEFSFAREQWSVMVCDEAQKIKNPNALVTRAAKAQNVRFRIACTGTPVENSLTDMWCLFDFIQPGLLPALNEFGKTYQRPIEAQGDPEKLARLEELRTTLEPQILRRMKSDVATDLPRKTENPVRLPMSSTQKKQYAAAISYFNQREELGKSCPMPTFLELLQYMRHVCTAPKEIGQKSDPRIPLTEYVKQSPKMKWLLDLLSTIKKTHEKVIIFCEFRDIQLLLQRYIKEVFNFNPSIVNGDTATSSGHDRSRQALIDAFSKGNSFAVIILSPIAVGYGVNVQAANHVIHYMRHWNPAKEDQATDRAYRIGQTKAVHVYYPIVTLDGQQSFDETLDALLTKRRDLAKDMLNGSGDLSPIDFDIADLIAKSDGSDKVENPRVNFERVNKMDARRFEAFCAALYSARGYLMVYRTPDSGDGGVDVVAIKEGRGLLIQCKSSAGAQGVTWDAVKDVVTGKAAYQLKHSGIVFQLVCITNSRFNEGAKRQAELNDVRLIDGEELCAQTRSTAVYLLDVEKHV